jgi:hypothetical protein
MTNTFLPLTQAIDGDFLSANQEARRMVEPYQVPNVSLFWIERRGDTYGAIRNLEFAGNRQDILWNEMLAKYSSALV